MRERNNKPLNKWDLIPFPSHLPLLRTHSVGESLFDKKYQHIKHTQKPSILPVLPAAAATNCD